MSVASDLINDINDWVTNDAAKSYKNKRLNNILLRLVAWINSGGTTGPIVNVPNIYPIHQADFINATDAPLVALDGLILQVYYNAASRFLEPTTEWTDLAGGGVRILLTGFDSAVAPADFFIFIST